MMKGMILVKNHSNQIRTTINLGVLKFCRLLNYIFYEIYSIVSIIPECVCKLMGYNECDRENCSKWDVWQ